MTSKSRYYGLVELWTGDEDWSSALRYCRLYYLLTYLLMTAGGEPVRRGDGGRYSRRDADLSATSTRPGPDSRAAVVPVTWPGPRLADGRPPRTLSRQVPGRLRRHRVLRRRGRHGR